MFAFMNREETEETQASIDRSRNILMEAIVRLRHEENFPPVLIAGMLVSLADKTLEAEFDLPDASMVIKDWAESLNDDYMG